MAGNDFSWSPFSIAVQIPLHGGGFLMIYGEFKME